MWQGATPEELAAVKHALWQLKGVCRAETVLLWKTYRCQMEDAYGLRLQVHSAGGLAQLAQHLHGSKRAVRRADRIIRSMRMHAVGAACCNIIPGIAGGNTRMLTSAGPQKAIAALAARRSTIQVGASCTRHAAGIQPACIWTYCRAPNILASAFSVDLRGGWVQSNLQQLEGDLAFLRGACEHMTQLTSHVRTFISASHAKAEQAAICHKVCGVAAAVVTQCPLHASS